MSARGLKLAGLAAAAVTTAGAATVGGAFAAIGVAALRSPKPREAPPDPLLAARIEPRQTRSVLAADGAALHVEIYGPDDPVGTIVLVHGWTCQIDFWRAQLTEFVRDHRVIAFDLRGHGRSELGTAKPTSGVLGADLAAVLEATLLNGERAVLVGHSLGGMALLGWARDHGADVAKYASGVLLASTAASDVIEESTVLPMPDAQPFNAVRDVVGRLILGVPAPTHEGAVADRFVQYGALAPQSTAEHVRFSADIIAACPAVTRARVGSAMIGVDVWGGVRNLTVPTTVLAGVEDRLTPPVHSVRIAGVLRDAGVLRETIILPGVGHMSPVEAGREVNEAIAGLLG